MKLTFRIHAIPRMFERSFSPEEVRSVVENGETIQEYPEDTPYPIYESTAKRSLSTKDTKYTKEF